jgi:hypothetical protein
MEEGQASRGCHCVTGWWLSPTVAAMPRVRVSGCWRRCYGRGGVEIMNDWCVAGRAKGGEATSAVEAKVEAVQQRQRKRRWREG